MFWKGFSASVEFTYLRKTPCQSRHELASPVMLCECAMEPSGGYDRQPFRLLHAHFEAPAAPVRTEPENCEWASGKWAGTIFRDSPEKGDAV